jgi:hypothetical protein
MVLLTLNDYDKRRIQLLNDKTSYQNKDDYFMITISELVLRMEKRLREILKVLRELSKIRRLGCEDGQPKSRC